MITLTCVEEKGKLSIIVSSTVLFQQITNRTQHQAIIMLQVYRILPGDTGWRSGDVQKSQHSNR